MIGQLQALAIELEDTLTWIKRQQLDEADLQILANLVIRIHDASADLAKIADLAQAFTIVSGGCPETFPINAKCSSAIVQSAYQLSNLLAKTLGLNQPEPTWAATPPAWATKLLSQQALFVLASRNGQILDASPAFCQLFGYAKTQLTQPGQPLPGLPRLVPGNDELPNHKSGAWQTISECRHMAGQPIWLQSLIQPLVSEDGDIGYYVSLHADITGLRQQRTGPVSATQQTFHEQSAMNPRLSHGMKTQLNSILGHAQLLALVPELDADAREQLREIADAGSHLASLINQLAEKPDTLPPIGLEDGLAPITPANQVAATILAVEDNPANQLILAKQLEVLGHTVQFANNGQEALHQLAKNRYALVLTDINMPGMNGMEFARVLRATAAHQKPSQPIIGITADNAPQVATACLGAGMDAVLIKPIELGALQQTLAKWLPSTGIATDTSLDLKTLMRYNGDLSTAQISNLVQLFIRVARKELKDCDHHLARNYFPGLAQAMHKLKATAQSIGALAFSEQAKRLEQAAKQQQTAECTQLLAFLHNNLAGLAQEWADQAQPSPNLAKTAAKPRGALVLDADETARATTAQVLETLGVNVAWTAASGAEALVQLGQAGLQIDLLVCDLALPDLSASDFLRHLAQSRCQAPLITVGDTLMAMTDGFTSLLGTHFLGDVAKPATQTHFRPLLAGCAGEAARRTAPAFSAEELMAGLSNNQFDVHFQPKADAHSLNPVSVEALARWRRPDRTVVADGFIFLTEQFDLIGPLSEALFIKAFFGGIQLAERGWPLSVAINLSQHLLADPGLADFLSASLQATGIVANKVDLEIPASVLAQGVAAHLPALERLSGKGFKLVVGHFGTANLALAQLPAGLFAEVKFDRTFLRRAAANKAAQKWLATQAAIARELRLLTVAEGLESDADLALAQAVGCDCVQGWAVAGAMPIDQMLVWLQTGHRAEQIQGR